MRVAEVRIHTMSSASEIANLDFLFARDSAKIALPLLIVSVIVCFQQLPSYRHFVDSTSYNCVSSR
jgi:hypothetical protein